MAASQQQSAPRAVAAVAAAAVLAVAVLAATGAHGHESPAEVLGGSALGNGTAGGNITCRLVSGPAKIECPGYGTYVHEETLVKPGTETFYIDVGVCTALILGAGVFSGLTLGMLSLDPMQLQVLQDGGTASDQKNARRIAPLVRRHHLLLVTLLLSNAVVAESLPLFLDHLVPEYLAIVISVTAVLVFGEVIPQAICSRYGLSVGAFFSPLVAVLMVIMSPIGYPLAKLLDLVLGADHTAYFRRSELSALVHMHSVENHNNEEPLTLDETLIIRGTLDMRDKTVAEAMTPLEFVFALDVRRNLDNDTMTEIIESGHSRVPIFEGEKEHMTTFLLVKNLIQYDPEDAVPIREVSRRRVIKVFDKTPLFDALHLFQSGKTHLVAVQDAQNKIIGIITLEDVIEELIQVEIVDETDVYEDVVRRVRVARARQRKQSIDLSASMPASALHGIQAPSGYKRRHSSSETEPLIGRPSLP